MYAPCQVIVALLQLVHHGRISQGLQSYPLDILPFLLPLLSSLLLGRSPGRRLSPGRSWCLLRRHGMHGNHVVVFHSVGFEGAGIISEQDTIVVEVQAGHRCIRELGRDAFLQSGDGNIGRDVEGQDLGSGNARDCETPIYQAEALSAVPL